MSHQVGVSGIPQIDTGSNLVPVLGQKPLSSVLRYTKSGYFPLGAHTPLCWGRFLDRSGVGSMGKKVKEFRSRNWDLQDSHGDVKYTTGNIVNNILITIYGARLLPIYQGDHRFISYVNV